MLLPASSDDFAAFTEAEAAHAVELVNGILEPIDRDVLVGPSTYLVAAVNKDVASVQRTVALENLQASFSKRQGQGQDLVKVLADTLAYFPYVHLAEEPFIKDTSPKHSLFYPSDAELAKYGVKIKRGKR